MCMYMCKHTHAHIRPHTTIIPTIDKSNMKRSGQGPGASDGKETEVTKDVMKLSP